MDESTPFQLSDGAISSLAELVLSITDQDEATEEAA
jgi:hypothetical protein